MKRQPWERRLVDLAHILTSCAETYFEPELFRRNTNNFLQTARTVTFIIQKHKADIPDFDSWYQANVLDAWKNDELMQWAKEARNTIEKEGDLELYSSLRVVLLLSYLEEDDVEVQCGRNELLRAGVQKLIRFSQKQLPTGVSDAAAIKIERLWITSKLKSHELLKALGYVYSRLFDCCRRLATHLGYQLPNSVLSPSDVNAIREDSRQVQIVKLKDLDTYRITTQGINRLPDESLPGVIKEGVAKLKETLGRPSDFLSFIAFYSGMAEITFRHWGYHVPMLFLFGRNWETLDFITPVFNDQSEKYFFWRSLAERVQIQNIYCLIYITEIWIRDVSGYPSSAIKDLPIRGEKLQLTAFDRDGEMTVRSWPIERVGDNELPTLGAMEVAEASDQKVFFLVPVMRSMGMEPDFVPRRHRENAE